MPDPIDEAKKLLKNQIKLREKNSKLFTARLRTLLNSYIRKALNFEGVELDEAASVIGGLFQGLQESGLNDLVKELRGSYAEELTTINATLSPVIKQKILSTADKEVVDALIDFDGKKITKLIAPYVDDIGSVAMRYAISGEKPDVEAILARSGDLLESQITTEVDTLLSSFSRTVTDKKAKEFELELFLYYGAVDKVNRDFCRDLLSKKPPIYSRDEIEAMENGQLSDVMVNCGGYNCRHQWIPITEEYAKELGYADKV